MLPQPGKNKTNKQKKWQKTKQEKQKASYTAKARVTASLLFTTTVTSSTHQQRGEGKMYPASGKDERECKNSTQKRKT